jgi:carbamoyltransferase
MLEEEMCGLIDAWCKQLSLRRLAAAGGIFLNVKLNQRLLEDGVVDEAFFFPAAGDGGLSAGAALLAHRLLTGDPHVRAIGHAFWGPSESDDAIQAILDERGLDYQVLDDPAETAADLIAQGRLLCWHQGAVECGPRALGGRSILVDPRRPENKDIVNARVKFREPFRPFCPSMTRAGAQKYLKYPERVERYMIVGYSVTDAARTEIPAVVHVDGTCRPQIVEEKTYPLFQRLISAFGRRTGVPCLLNTSFNIKGDPIVCSARDAIKCFFDTGLDDMVLGKFLVSKHR